MQKIGNAFALTLFDLDSDDRRYEFIAVHVSIELLSRQLNALEESAKAAEDPLQLFINSYVNPYGQYTGRQLAPAPRQRIGQIQA